MSQSEIRALVVEDEPVTRRMLQDILKLRGSEVKACADAETAWIAYKNERFALVLMDLRLPGMDGVELCRRIRKVPGSDETVVLFVTGVEDRVALEAALDAGADDYLLKPINPHQLHVRLAIAERRILHIRERKEREDHLRRDALHDLLTGLANRTFLKERIDHAARRSVREDGYLYAVLYVDLNDFALLNRRIGRDAANEILKEVGERLEDSVRSVDTVARLDADRFALLLDGLNDVSDPSRVANRALQSLSSPFEASGHRTGLSACIGIAISAAAGYTGADDILEDAHSALDEAKAQGPGSYRIYDPVMQAKAMARIELESRLRQALEREEMELHYQPLVWLQSGRVAGFEALARWSDGRRGQMSPTDFIPVAEGSGLILTLGSWVIDRAVDQLEEWSGRSGDGSPFFVSVNVSGRQFMQPDLADQIGTRLRKAGLPGQMMHVEITETSLMDRVDTVATVLSRLKDHAIPVQVDDFGTGYSSLSYLCRFPIDTLKIDRSFIGQMEQSAESLEVVRTIVRLGKNLGMALVAEGVETERQLELLREMECDLAQGYLFSRPLTAADAGAVLDDPVLA